MESARPVSAARVPQRPARCFAAVALVALPLGAAPGDDPSPAGGPARDDPWQVAREAVTFFDDRHGLPQSSVSTLVVDRLGRLWAGTQDGLARFDGRGWESFDLPERGQPNWVRSLALGADGALWVGSSHGVHRRAEDGSWRSWHVADGLPSESVRSLLVTVEEGAEVVHAGTQAGIARRRGDRWERIAGETELGVGPVLRLLERGEGGARELWAATARGGVAIRDMGGWRRLGEAQGLLPGGIRTLVPARAEGAPAVWAGFIQSPGSARIAEGGARVDAFPPGRAGFPETLTLDFAPLRAEGRDEVWAATASAGVLRFDGGSWRPLAANASLPPFAVWSLLPWPSAERPRAVFAGTDGAGVARIDLGGWRSLAGAPGLGGSSAYSMAESAAGAGVPRFLLGTSERGLLEYRDGAWRPIGPPELAQDAVLALLAVPDGAGAETLWIGTSRSGLWRLDASGFRHEPMPFSPTPAVRGLLAVRDDRGGSSIWIATRSGPLLRRADGAVERPAWAVDPVVPVEGLYGFARTGAGTGGETLWLASDAEGLLFVREGRLARVDGAAGLPSSTVVQLLVEPLAEGRERLWLATAGGGAGWLDPAAPAPRIEVLDTRSAPALPNDSLYALARDADGRIYFVTNRGVARLEGGAADPRRGRLRVYTAADGLPSNEGNQGAAYADRRGRIWVGTVRGPAVLDPRFEVEDPEPKPLRFAGATAAGAPVALDGARLGHDRLPVTIHFALASLVRGEESTYRTELVGFDPAPRPWTREASRELGALPAGEYRFRVWARDAFGVESGPIELAFAVLPPAWRSWPALAAYALLAVLLLRGAHELRVRRVQRRFAAVVAERNRVARELHDTVMQSLAGIALQVDEAEWRLGERPEAARAALERSRELVRDAHAEVRRSIWGLRAGALEEQDLPAALLAQARQLAQGTGLEVRGEVRGSVRRLAPELELELLRIGQEATTNALKHAQARVIELAVEFGERSVRLSVRDDGRGFAARGGADAGAAGFGLGGMRERAARIGGELVVASRPGHGTTVSVEAPITASGVPA